MRVLVTGGAGFIGSNLVDRFIEEGAESVAVIDDLSSGLRGNVGSTDVRFFEGSILDPALLDQAAAGADSIVHLAARPSVPRSITNPLASHHANATGTLSVLEAARKHNCHVVVASSSSVYGANPVLPKHEALQPMPLSPYAVSKLATEAYALSYQAVFGVPALAFRFFNVYGPRQAAGHAYAAVVPTLIDQALRGLPLTVHGDGLQTRDFTFVDTVTETIVRSVRGRVTSESPVNLAFGSRDTLLNVIALIQAEVNTPLQVVYEPTRAGDVRDSQADSTLLNATVPGIRPVDLRHGIQKTVAWTRELLGA